MITNDNQQEQLFLETLIKARNSEDDAVRIWSSVLAVAPKEYIPQILEIINDEVDHNKIASDILIQFTAGIKNE